MKIRDPIFMMSAIHALLTSIFTVIAGEKFTDIADRRQLFVDQALIDQMDRLSLRLHEPTSGGIAIRIDKPWEGPANSGYVVVWHGGQYLMYYRAMTLRSEDKSGVLCVAVSEDGINWTKPTLGLVEHTGSRQTNIVADETGQGFMPTPWLDTRPGVPQNQRIKAIASEPLSGKKHTAFDDPQGPKRLVFWGSGDGFAFQKLDPQPQLVSELRNCFDGGNTMFWSETEQQYVLYYRWYDNKWGSGYRSVARTTSKDLMIWTPPCCKASPTNCSTNCCSSSARITC